jgi:large subunit ribosomal protein L21
MYAVIKDRGKQYTVRPGERVRIDLMPVAPGEAIVFDEVLLLTDGDAVQVGQPQVAGASVTATVVGEHLDPKLIIFKKKRRKKYRRKQGHRQRYTDVIVDTIS